MIDYSSEFQQLAKAYELSGGDPANLTASDAAILLVSGNRVLLEHGIPGVIIKSQPIENGVKTKITVKKGVKLKSPIHLCFGVLPADGIQNIRAEFIIEDQASANFLAHCSFPNAAQVQHIMHGKVKIGKNAHAEYDETHYHGPDGGVDVLPVMKVFVEKGGSFVSTFKLIQGAAGKVDLEYKAYVEENGSVEMNTKLFGKKNDRIKVRESIYLDGQNAHGLAKSRIVVSEKAQAKVLGEVTGNGPHSRGHVDCMEIIRGQQAKAEAIPKLLVVDETAKLTHEAAIGSVDKKQVETLMSRGLTADEAANVIVMGLLK